MTEKASKKKASKKKVSKKKTARKKTSRKSTSSTVEKKLKDAEKAVASLNEGLSVGPVKASLSFNKDGLAKPPIPIATYSSSPIDKVGRNPDPQSEQKAKEVLAIVKYYREQIRTKNNLIETLESENESLRNRLSILKSSVENYENSIDEHLVTVAEERVLGEDDLVNSLASLFYYPSKDENKKPSSEEIAKMLKDIIE